MTERAPLALDWAATRRRRWSVARLAAAAGLNLLVLLALRLAVDRVELPRHGPDRVTRLVTVTLHVAPPPPHALPPPRMALTAPGRSGVHATTPSPARANAPARAPAPPREDTAQAITLPTPPTSAAVAPVAAASTPPADLRFLDNAATRQAIRAVARGDTLASAGNALTDRKSVV